MPTENTFSAGEMIDAPVHGVPAEILIHIFSCNAFCYYQPINFNTELQHTHNKIPPQLQNTINASQVCHRWRTTALLAPELWSGMIDMDHPCPDWIALLLKRSEPLGITFMPSAYSKRRRSFELEMRLNHRIAEYRLNADHPATEIEIMDKILSNIGIWGGFPKLQTLYIRSSDPWTRLRNFVGPSTPNLQRLYLENCGIQYKQLTSFIDSLTTLHISAESDQVLRLEELFEEIPKLHHLQELLLISEEVMLQTFFCGLATLDLSHMEEFTLHQSFTWDCNMQRLTFQNGKLLSCQIQVLIYWNAVDEDDVQSLTRLLLILLGQITDYRPFHNQRYTFGFSDYGFWYGDVSRNIAGKKVDRGFRFEMKQDKPGRDVMGGSFDKQFPNIIHSIILELSPSFYQLIDTISLSDIHANRYEDLKVAWLIPFIKSVISQRCQHVNYLTDLSESNWHMVYDIFMELSTDTSLRLGHHLFLTEVVLNTITITDDEVGEGDEPVYTLDTGDAEVMDPIATKDIKGGGRISFSGNSDNEAAGCTITNQDVQEDDILQSGSDSDSDFFPSDEEDHQAEMTMLLGYLQEKIKESDIPEQVLDLAKSLAGLEQFNLDDGYIPKHSEDSDSDSDSDESDSYFDRQPTLYDQIIELCQVVPTIRVVRQVPCQDIDVTMDCDVFQPRSQMYLETKLHDLGVEVEYK